MKTYCMKNERNETVVQSFYHDAYIHTEDKKILNAHKVILAMHSPFLHDYFQSRPGHVVNDVLFQNTHSGIVKAALDLMYNGKVSIETKHLRSFTWFLQTLLGVPVHETIEPTPHEPQEPTVSESTIEGNTEQPVTDSEPPNVPVKDTAGHDKESVSSLCTAWTLTTVTSEDLRQAGHSVKILTKNNQQYKCDVCKHITTSFSDASEHFIDKHQNCEKERKQIENAMNARKSCLSRISKLKNEISQGCNQTMAMNQLGMIVDELNTHLDVLCDFEKTKLLPPVISRKAREMCHALNETIRDVDMIIKQNDKK
jgi:hypothetical protein